MNRTVVISEPGAMLRVEREHLQLVRDGRTVREFPLATLAEVFCLGRTELTGGALQRCLRHGIRIILLSRDGRYLGHVTGPMSRNGELRLAQYQAVVDDTRATCLAREVIRAKMLNQRTLLLRRQRDLRSPDLAMTLIRMRRLLESLDVAAGVDTLRGIEGACAKEYFQAFPLLILNPLFTFSGRNRRPPKDPVNAMLSFGYTLVGSILEAQVEAAGLDPALGCLHAPAHGRPSLMLDLLEEFRPMIVDSTVLRLVNRHQVGPTDFGPPIQEPDDEDVDEDNGSLTDETAAMPTDAVWNQGCGEKAPVPGRTERGVHLRGPGKKVFIGALLSRMRERLYYPDQDGTFDLRSIMRAQVYRMARAFVDPGAGYRGFSWRG